MKTFATALTCACLLMGGGLASAQDKKPDAATNHQMTAQECREHMAVAKKDGTPRDDSMMKKDAQCADMMKKEGASMKDTTTPPAKN
jgi:hypothetical protein